jgi:ubiquinone biosynthesis protein
MFLFRPIIVLWNVLPFLVSFIRDWRRWILFGPPRQLTHAQKKKRAHALTNTIASLGPTFIKLVQVLGMREDILPKLYTDEFKKLQDQAPPFAFRKVKKTIKAELGKDVDEIFKGFEPTPIAAASLGQVHKASYRGEEVAVKILRPDVQAKVNADLKVLGALILILNYFIISHYLRSLWILYQEFSKMIREEMDFLKEAANGERFRRIFEDNPQVIIPKIYHEICTRKILVLKFYEGTRVDDIEGLKALDISPDELVRILVDLYTRQVVIHGFLHADPHPGNLLVTRDRRLVIVDYGMTVTFDPDVKIELLKVSIAAVRQDIHGVVNGFYKLRMVDPEINIATLRDAAQLLMSIQFTTKYRPQLIQQITDDILKTFYKFPLRLPSNLVYLFRAATLVEGIGISFDPHFNAVRVGAPIVKDLVKEVYVEPERKWTDRLIDKGRDVLEFFENIQKVAFRAEREQLKVKAHAEDIMEIERFLSIILRRSLIGILATGLAVVSAILYISLKSKLLLIGSFALSFLIMVLLILLPIRRRFHL